MRAWRWGLTGGIGSGKSTVANILVSLGATLIDTDAIAHSLTGPGGAAMPQLREAFGDEIATADNALDRARMRALAFADAGAKRRLEAVLHPMIGSVALQQAVEAPGTVIFDVPLLAESLVWRTRCDRILVVDCSESTQIARVMTRSGWTEQQVRHVIDLQASRHSRRAIADAVISNDGLSFEALRTQVTRLWDEWTTMATGGATVL